MVVTIYSDGGSLNNPGQAAIGYVVSANGKKIQEESRAIGVASNNVAEYTALITALTYVKDCILPQYPQVDKIEAFADSLLMVNQLNGLFKVKNHNLKNLFHQIKILQEKMGVPVIYTHVIREKNQEADALVKKALNQSV
ncbi:hypothetical protein A3F03_04085 [Candidatus Roizmanbacteria bacterium RIFCSPHIGHO2_12_FULL_41_11]|uniref:RNase H type-1 domain-containing protein n=3 Tax=Candidatus Roizmaniibacteriota TaxID=1752723 RepID=A0A1F7JQZ7_9BACT|nr:MAG: hypothetical protein A3F03_04085 [Candidatus Roizmanbacteria bacterium RIFCSPHIGHO2_12_FULL_41_11]OGK51982.1 MAG: hypothetical protein A2966_04225 [Candidatus Roizmanbacteria bacterium RIFCSPLOWO2_01_FULL_41_22]OGK58026.1 MAG: hypothetical protein A3H86_01030 [Candidatus Roizmanbacteria bacterium RIFCSPLOWO2_02_FULL_41_9]